MKNTDELINRINTIARKQKTIGLTDEEKVEQNKLRKQYIELVKKNLANQLKTIKVVDIEGNDITPQKLTQLKDEALKK